MTEHACGSVHRQPVPAIAAKAAQCVLGYASPRAVTIDPSGMVRVEPPHSAAECDLVGVYARSLGVLELIRRLTEDLRYEVATRQLRPKIRRKRALGTEAKRARGSA